MKNADNMNNENKSKRGIRNMSMRTKWLITGGLCILAVLTVVLCAMDGCFDFKPGSVQANDKAAEESAAPASNIEGTTSGAKYKVLVTAGNGGSADPNGSITVDEWGSVTVSFTPNEGYEIQSVTVDGADKGAVESETLSYITADHSIMATFVKTPEPTPTVEPTADIPDIDDEN